MHKKTNDDLVKGGLKSKFLDLYRGGMSIFGVDETLFNGVLKQNSLDMYKNDIRRANTGRGKI